MSRFLRTGTAASSGLTPSISTWYSVFWPLMPKETPTLPCASRSMSSVEKPRSASPAATDTLVVVFPVPPFWFITAMARDWRSALDNALARASRALVRLLRRGQRSSARPALPASH